MAALKTGWEDAGGGMVRNAAGQLTYVGSQQYNDAPGGDPAQTQAGAPAATPGQPTPEQQAQSEYLKQATQTPTDVDPKTDPAIRTQADAYSADVTRAQRDYVDQQAEKLGPYATGALQNEERLAQERGGQAAGSFEAQLVGREIQARRDEKAQALAALTQSGQFDKAQAMQRELAQLDAQLKTLGINSQSSIANRELDQKDKFGTMSGNLDLMRILQGGQEFDKNLGFNIGDREAYWNNQAVQQLF